MSLNYLVEIHVRIKLSTFMIHSYQSINWASQITYVGRLTYIPHTRFLQDKLTDFHPSDSTLNFVRVPVIIILSLRRWSADPTGWFPTSLPTPPRLPPTPTHSSSSSPDHVLASPAHWTHAPPIAKRFETFFTLNCKTCSEQVEANK